MESNKIFENYMYLKSSGVLYEFCPWATGTWTQDEKNFTRYYARISEKMEKEEQ